MRCDGEPYRHGEVIEGAYGYRLVVDTCPDVREGSDHEVEDSVQVCEIETEDLDNGLCSQETERADEVVFKVCEGAIVLSVEILVLGGLAQLSGFTFEEDGAIGLAEEDESDYLDGGYSDGDHVEAPSP